MQQSILFEDDYLLAVDKIPGMLVHKSWLDSSATQFAQNLAEEYCGQKLHTLHRLDRPASGVLLFGKTPDVARAMLGQFSEQKIRKSYLLIARGWTKVSGVIDAPLAEELDKIADKFAKKDKPAKEAVTEYCKLAHTELAIPVSKYPKARYSLVLAEPKTGRKHQIRRHFRKISHHLISDTRHGDGRHNDLFIRHFGWKQLALRAMQVEFKHPANGQDVVIHAGLTDSWRDILAQLGWSRLTNVLDRPIPDWLHHIQ
ncbi:pseudouridine synthase [Gynuella sp.]|uniref:pseudouridine synthase n=1 Tax=Gynuella sp. TaxID=2969146 RepID=UPI003D12B20B